MANYFYFDQNNQKCGPVNDQQLKALAAQGVINPNTPMETDTGHQGLAGQIPDLFAATPPPFVSQTQAAPHPGSGIVSAGITDNSTTLIICSVLALCCCFPAGVAGIIFAILSKNDLAAGNYESAAKNFKIASWCSIGGLVAGIILWVIYFILQFMLSFFIALAEI